MLPRRIALITVTFALLAGAVTLAVRARAAPHRQGTTVPSQMSFQGRLADAKGVPLERPITLTLRIFDAADGGTLLWGPETHPDVPLANGLFHVLLGQVQPLALSALTGSTFIEIEVNGEVLEPRLPVVSAAYALRAGDAETLDGFQVSGTGDTLDNRFVNAYGPETLRAEAESPALAVTNQAGGDGLRASSTNGNGAYGETASQDAEEAGVYGTSTDVAAGVLGWSQSGIGVRAKGRVGVKGASFEGGGVGILASREIGVYGSSPVSDGVQGMSLGGAQVAGNGVYGMTNSGQSDRAGVFGESLGQAPGVYGLSDQGHGVVAESLSNAEALLVKGGARVEGDLTVTGSKSGYVVDIALNEDDQPLERGDVVIIVGVAEPVAGHIPVMRVRCAATAGSTAVAGVVDRRHVRQAGDRQAEAGPAAPGEYLTVVTLGAFAWVKADASYGPIAPGDLLVASNTPGHTMRAVNPQPGTVIGKALEPLDTGQGLIAVLVTLQ